MEHKATGACGCANCFTESMDDAFYCRDCEEISWQPWRHQHDDAEPDYKYRHCVEYDADGFCYACGRTASAHGE